MKDGMEVEKITIERRGKRIVLEHTDAMGNKDGVSVKRYYKDVDDFDKGAQFAYEKWEAKQVDKRVLHQWAVDFIRKNKKVGARQHG